MKVSVMYTLELDRQAISLTKEQAEALYSQLGNLLNKNTTTPYPIINPPASPYTIPNTGPYPWTPVVTSYSTEYTGDESGYPGVKCRENT